MSRYKALRILGCYPIVAGSIAFLNWLFGVRANEIRFMNITIEFDNDATEQGGQS